MSIHEDHRSPRPQPLCLVYEPMLPLLAWHELDGESAWDVQAHVGTCAWCQQRLREYAQLDMALQRHLGLDSVEPVAFNLEAFMDHLDTENEPHQPLNTRQLSTSTASEGTNPTAQTSPTTPKSQSAPAPTAPIERTGCGGSGAFGYAAGSLPLFGASYTASRLANHTYHLLAANAHRRAVNARPGRSAPDIRLCGTRTRERCRRWAGWIVRLCCGTGWPPPGEYSFARLCQSRRQGHDVPHPNQSTGNE